METPQGGFVQLTPTVAEYIARAIETGRHMGTAEKRSALQDRQERTEKNYDEWAWNVLDGKGATPELSRP